MTSLWEMKIKKNYGNNNLFYLYTLVTLIE